MPYCKCCKRELSDKYTKFCKTCDTLVDFIKQNKIKKSEVNLDFIVIAVYNVSESDHGGYCSDHFDSNIDHKPPHIEIKQLPYLINIDENDYT